MWKAEKLKIRLFGPFWSKSGLFRQKEDQFRFAIRPRSDKADLLGSTVMVWFGRYYGLGFPCVETVQRAVLSSLDNPFKPLIQGVPIEKSQNQKSI